jgi:hypothetical protein
MQLDTTTSIIYTTMTPTEEATASILNSMQITLLKNDEALALRNLAAIEFDETRPILFAQNQATLKAQVDFIRYLLLRHEQAQLQLQQAPQS